MKKLLFLAILISSTFFAQAQKKDKSPTERAQAKVEKLGETLNLTDTQKEQIYALFLEQGATKMGGKQMSEFTKEEREAYKAERKDQRAAFDTKMGEILTPEQFATYQEKNSKYGKGPKKGKGKHNGKGPKSSEEKLQKRVAELTERLDLTTEQQTQVAALLQAQQANRPEKGAKKDWSEAEKAEAKAAKKAAKAEFDASMKNILSAEQYATFQSERMDRKKGGNKSQEERVQKKVDKLTEQLNLTPAQQTQIHQVIAEQQANKPTKGEGKSPAAKAARKEAKAAFNEKMKTILSAEQYATFESLEKSNRRKGKGRKKNKKDKKDKKYK